jgi:hypothetical protein
MGLLPGPEHARRGPRGGIDVSSGTADAVYTLKKVRGAQKYVPEELEISSGSDHLGLVRDLGVPGEAAKQPDGPGSCRTMPDGVRERIKAEARR